MSEADSVVDLTVVSPKRQQAGAKDAASIGSAEMVTKRPKGTALAGKSVMITGTWVTMSAEQAKELCRANGGRVTTSASSKTDYVIVGSKGTRQDASKYGTAQVLSEMDLLALVLAPYEASKENTSVSAGEKRPADTQSAAAGPSKVAKTALSASASSTSLPTEGLTEEQLNRLTWFTADSGAEIRLERKTLTAFDCGGQVYKAQRGKNAVQLLGKFADWLEACNGYYH